MISSSKARRLRNWINQTATLKLSKNVEVIRIRKVFFFLDFGREAFPSQDRLSLALKKDTMLFTTPAELRLGHSGYRIGILRALFFRASNVLRCIAWENPIQRATRWALLSSALVLIAIIDTSRIRLKFIFDSGGVTFTLILMFNIECCLMSSPDQTSYRWSLTISTWIFQVFFMFAEFT